MMSINTLALASASSNSRNAIVLPLLREDLEGRDANFVNVDLTES